MFGDIRDALREGKRLATGEQADELVLGLACVGIAITAGTYATFGAAAPARVGLTLAKAARKTGRIGAEFAASLGPLVRRVVDWRPLRRAATNVSLAEPAVASAPRAKPSRSRRAGGLLQLAGDVGRVEEPRPARRPRSMVSRSQRAARRGARRQARRERGQQDARNPQGCGPRRALRLRRSPSMSPSGCWARCLPFSALCRRSRMRPSGRPCGFSAAAGSDARAANCGNCSSGGARLDITHGELSNGDVEIAYLDEGEGDPIVLVHGFASTKEVNWVQPGWVATLTRAGRRVIALDNRGHGAVRPSSTIRPTITPPRWRTTCARCSIICESSAPTSWAIRWARASRRSWRVKHPERVRSVILGGLGIQLVDGVGLPESIAEALEAPSLDDVTDPDRPRLPRLCRSDQIRSPRAGRLHPRLAADADARARWPRSACRCWSRSAPRTTSRARPGTWPR